MTEEIQNQELQELEVSAGLPKVDQQLLDENPELEKAGVEVGDAILAGPKVKELEEVIKSNPNVKVVEVSGIKYNEIFDPETGTTHLEKLMD